MGHASAPSLLQNSSHKFKAPTEDSRAWWPEDLTTHSDSQGTQGLPGPLPFVFRVNESVPQKVPGFCLSETQTGSKGTTMSSRYKRKLGSDGI